MSINAIELINVIESNLSAVYVNPYKNHEHFCPVKEIYICKEFRNILDAQALTISTKDGNKFRLLVFREIK